MTTYLHQTPVLPLPIRQEEARNLGNLPFLDYLFAAPFRSPSDEWRPGPAECYRYP